MDKFRIKLVDCSEAYLAVLSLAPIFWYHFCIMSQALLCNALKSKYSFVPNSASLDSDNLMLIGHSSQFDRPSNRKKVPAKNWNCSS